MDGAHAQQLLRAGVQVRGIQLGRVVDVIFERDVRRALGLAVQCGDEERRFLPFSVARLESNMIELQSPLVLLDESELRFYTERGATFGSLLDRFVVVRGHGVGTLADLLLAEDGTIEAIVVSTPAGMRRIAYDETVAIAERPFRAAS